MRLSRRHILAAAAALPVLAPFRRARAQTAPLKIGVLNDQSGPHKHISGLTSVVCARQAIEDFGAANKGIAIEVITADHKNDPDRALSIVRQWIDGDGVDVVMDVAPSPVALALNPLMQEKNKVLLATGASTAALTGEQCSPNLIHWTYDTYMLSRSTGGGLVKAGGDTWYFMTSDNEFVMKMKTDTSDHIRAAGGKVLGASTYPFAGTTDFTPFLRQALASNAKVLAVAKNYTDTMASMKQLATLGVGKSLKLAGLLMFINDVHAFGLEAAQGMNLTESFYWDMNDKTRAFTNRVKPKTPDNYPGMIHAGCYSATLHYLKIVADMGQAEARKDGAATVARMKKMTVEDDCFGKTRIREDGRNLTTAHLFEVKKPSESQGPWDYYKLVSSTPGEEAYRPLADGRCPLVKT